MMSATSEEADIMCSLGEGFKEEAIEALAIPEEKKPPLLSEKAVENVCVCQRQFGCCSKK